MAKRTNAFVYKEPYAKIKRCDTVKDTINDAGIAKTTVIGKMTNVITFPNNWDDDDLISNEDLINIQTQIENFGNDDTGNFESQNFDYSIVNKVATTSTQISFSVKRKTKYDQDNSTSDIIPTKQIAAGPSNVSINHDYDQFQATQIGEVTMLRQKLDAQQKLIETMRKEKLENYSSSHQELKNKQKELEHQILSLQAIIEFKDLELEQMKHSVKTTQKTNPLNTHKLYSVADLFTESKMNIPRELYAPSEIINSNDLNVETIFNGHFEKLKTLKLNMKSLNSINKENLEKALIIVKEAFLSIYQCVINLEQILDDNPKRHIEKSFEIKILYSKINPEKSSINQNGIIFMKEKGEIIRRLIAAISNLCKFSNEFTFMLFTNKHQFQLKKRVQIELTLIELLIKILNQLNTSTRVNLYHGILDAITSIFESVTKITSINDLIFKQCIDLIHVILICRPHSMAITRISRFLMDLSGSMKNYKYLKKLCTKENFKTIKLTKLNVIGIRSSISCLLQLFGVIIQSEYSVDDRKLTNYEYNQLAINTEYLYLFLNNCLGKSITFLEITINLSTGYPSLCRCCVQIINAVITLCYTCLEFWVQDHTIIELAQIKRICKLTIDFIYKINQDETMNAIISTSEYTLVHRLQQIFKWIMQFKETFRLDENESNQVQLIATALEDDSVE